MLRVGCLVDGFGVGVSWVDCRVPPACGGLVGGHSHWGVVGGFPNLLYFEVVRLGWALIHELFDDWILHELRTDVRRVLLVAVNKVADFAEAELHRVHSQRASFVREDVPYLAQLLVDGTVKYFTLLV